MRLRSLFAHVSVIVLSSLFVLPIEVYAQYRDNCDETQLRDLGVVTIACNPLANSSSCGAGASLTGADNKEKIYNYLIREFSPTTAAGIMGNLLAESGLNPKRVQGTPTPSGDRDNITVDNRTGYGLAQWTSRGRQQGLADLAQSRRAISGDLHVQLDYLMQELTQNYTAIYDALKAAGTLDEASDIFMIRFERPKDQSEAAKEKRRGFGRAILEQLNAGQASPTNGSGCELSADGCPVGPATRDQMVDAGGITVHPCIANEVRAMVEDAQKEGLTLAGGGWRDSAAQQQLREAHCPDPANSRASDCSPPTAPVGESRHERGTGVDFTCNGTLIPNHSDPCFQFLEAHTKLKNLNSEPWHWSIDGS